MVLYSFRCLFCFNLDDLWFFPLYSINVRYYTVFLLLKHSCIPGINFTWLWWIILLICCLVQFTNLLMGNFESIFGIWVCDFFFLWCFYLSLYWLNGHEFEQALGVSDGQGSLVCYSLWGFKESDRTEWLNWPNRMCYEVFLSLEFIFESLRNIGDKSFINVG